MKKIILCSILSASLVSATASATELGLDVMSGASGFSSLSIVASPLLSSAALAGLFKNLSSSSTTIKVNKVEDRKNGKTYIQGDADGQPIEFETATKAVKDAKLKNGDNIKVEDAKIGYVLKANDVGLGLVPTSENTNYFKQKKIN